jgi:hypothetical protein
MKDKGGTFYPDDGFMAEEDKYFDPELQLIKEEEDEG